MTAMKTWRPDWGHVVLIYAMLLMIALGGCEALRDGVGKTDFWADREKAKY